MEFSRLKSDILDNCVLGEKFKYSYSYNWGREREVYHKCVNCSLAVNSLKCIISSKNWCKNKTKLFRIENSCWAGCELSSSYYNCYCIVCQGWMLLELVMWFWNQVAKNWNTLLQIMLLRKILMMNLLFFGIFQILSISSGELRLG